MKNLFARLFPIKSSEWSGALLFFSLQAVLAFGAAIARSAGFTLLVGKLGNDFLPVAFILVDLSVMLGSFAYVKIAKKTTGIRIVYALMASMAIFSVISWLLLSSGFNWAYGLFFIGFFALHVLSIIHLANFTASHYTPVQSKRVMSFIYAGMPVGGMLGGATLIALLNFLQPSTLVLMLVFSSVGVVFIAYRINQKLVPLNIITRKITPKKISPLKALKQTVQFIFQNPLLRYMAVGTLLFVLTSRLLEFQYQGIIYPEAYPDLAERSAFFGQYEIIANFCWLLFQLFISSRILVSLGVGGSNLVHPALVVCASGGLLFSFSFVPALIAQFVNQELRFAIRGPANNLLLNAIPRVKWPSVQAFLNGMVFPLATLIASGLLLWMKDAFEPNELARLLPIFSLLLGVVGILIAWRQWRSYNQGIIELLSEKVKSKNNTKGLKAELQHYLQQKDLRQVGIALEMVRSLKDPTFIPLVGKRLVHAHSFEIKRECAKTLAALPKIDASLKYLLRSLRFETDPETQAILLVELSHFSGESVIRTARGFLKHPYPEVFAAACFCLLQQKQAIDTQNMTDKILVRLTLQSRQQRLHSIKILGQLQNPALDSHLAPFLNSNDPILNIAAFHGWIQLHQDYLEDFKTELLNTLTETKTTEKQIIALQALQSCSAPKEWQTIIAFLHASNTNLTEAAVTLITQHLKQAKSTVIKTLHDISQPLKQRQQCLQLVWHLLTTAQKNKLINLGKTTLQHYLKIQAEYFALNASVSTTQSQQTQASHALLLKCFQEQALDELQYCLDIMAFSSGKDLSFSYRLSLGLRANNKNEQGNALEALSNCRENQLSTLIFTVFDSELTNQQDVLTLLKTLFPQYQNQADSLALKNPFTQSVWCYWEKSKC